MRIKILKFPDGRLAVTNGLRVEVNKQNPKETYELDVDRKEMDGIIEKPHKQAFRLRGRKPIKVENRPKT